MDKAKVEVIETLPPPINIKTIHSFLGHASFYRQFIRDFSKFAKPLCNLLMKDIPFDFSNDCLQAFKTLKEKLMTAPIIVAPNWSLPLEIISDASDFAIGAVLGQRRGKDFQMIYHASRILNDA